MSPPTFRYHHVTNAVNWLPSDAEPLARTKASATPVRRAESSRLKTLHGQRVNCLGVRLVVQLSVGFEGLLSILVRQNTAREAVRALASVLQLHEDLRCCLRCRRCGVWRHVVRRVVSDVSKDAIAFTVKNCKTNECIVPTTERHIPRDWSFGELRSLIFRLFVCRNCFGACADGRTSFDTQTNLQLFVQSPKWRT